MNRVMDEYSNMMNGDGGIAEPPEDTIPPTVEITTGEITDTSISITVNATDDSGEIASYKYYINDELKDTLSTNTYTFSGLAAETEYTIKVEAFDKANNKGKKTTTVSTNMKVVKGAPIPEGFYYVGGSKDEGVVISDNPSDEGKGTDHNTAQNVLQGNQFVWIPVEDDSKFKRYAGYYKGQLQSLNGNEPYAKGYAKEQEEFDTMKESVLKHNGFYVGRYETGTNAKRTSNTGIADEAVIKQGKNVYNYIGWSNSDDMTNEKGGAVEKAKNFAKEHDYSSVTSTLVYGVQWDAIMNFIDPAYAERKCDTSSSFVANSTSKGWYSQTAPATTGSNVNYAVKNIYDLGGNMFEWTMEAADAYSRNIRGRRF